MNNKIKLSVLIMLLVAAPISFADEYDTINFIAGVSALHDNNVFRSSINPSSDVISNAYLGVRFNKQYGLQRFSADYTRTENKYRNNNFLNFGANNYSAIWDWSMTPRLTGRLYGRQSQRLVDFINFLSNTRQIVNTYSQKGISFDYSPHNVWHLLGGYEYATSENTQAFDVIQGFQEKSYNYGLRYQFASNSKITIMAKSTDGDLDNPLSISNLLDNGYRDNDYYIETDWRLTGKSTLIFNIGHTKRDFDNFDIRNYSGAQGKLTYAWQPTGKLSVITSLSRRLSSFNTAVSSYVQDDVFSIAPSYALTPKITLTGNIQHSERAFLGEGPLIASLNRKDDLNLLGAQLSWVIHRNVELGVNATYSKRDSNNNFFDFDDKSAGLSLSLTY